MRRTRRVTDWASNTEALVGIVPAAERDGRTWN
jgi:hypothetical protein